MKLPRFTKWFAALPALNQPQRLQVQLWIRKALRPAAGLQQVLALMSNSGRSIAAALIASANAGTGTAAPTSCSATAAAHAGATSTT